MKKLIKWIADVSGVSKEIRKEAYKEAGRGMQQYADWFTEDVNTSNILYEYPEWCLKLGNPFLIESEPEKVRTLVKMYNDRKVFLVKNNKR